MFKKLLLSTLLLSTGANALCQEKQEVSQLEKIQNSLLLFSSTTFIVNFLMSFEDMIHIFERDLPSFIQLQKRLNTWITSQNFTAEQMKNFLIENPDMLGILSPPNYNALWKKQRLLYASCVGLLFAIAGYASYMNKNDEKKSESI